MASPNDSEQPGGKSLGEKLADAFDAAHGNPPGGLWALNKAEGRATHEKVALAFVVSLSHDEEKAALIRRAQEVEAKLALIEARPCECGADDQCDFAKRTIAAEAERDALKSAADEHALFDAETDLAFKDLDARIADLEAERDALREALADWSTDAPPMRRDGWIEVRSVNLYRWCPYKPDGARQMRKAGRWQKHTGHAFENAELPEGAEWRPARALQTKGAGE